MKNSILILENWKGEFFSSRKHSTNIADNSVIKKHLEEYGYIVEIINLHDIEFPSKYDGWYVVYPSSEDAGLFYKQYIEDVLLRLQLDGAILIPEFILFRAHHNKSFMELLRSTLPSDFNELKSVSIYSVKELEDSNKIGQLGYPIVVKTATGSGSTGVKIANNYKQLRKYVNWMGRVVFLDQSMTLLKRVKYFIKDKTRKIFGFTELQTVPRQPVVLQQFVPRLSGDYKVLVFADRYYLLRRNIRDNDFRASGSGKFVFPQELSSEEKCVLDYAKKLFESVQAPFASFDIANDGEKCYLIEYQYVFFGPYTVEFSSHYYKKQDDKWVINPCESTLEFSIAYAINKYIAN